MRNPARNQATYFLVRLPARLRPGIWFPLDTRGPFAQLFPMPRPAPRLHYTAIGILLLAIIVIFFLRSDQGDRFHLPVGNRTPAISLGARHGLILASDGSLWAWGSDFLGWPVLGLGKSRLQSTSLRRIGLDTNWTAISAAESHNLALKSDGTLWTWGESVHGPGVRPVSIHTPTLAAPGNDWKQAAAGGIHSLAIKKDGTLWAWGDNWPGTLGIPGIKGAPAPMQVGSGTNWTKVWAGILETVAMQSDGSLWYWGDNPNPTYAMNSNQVSAPMRISPDTNWTDVGFGPWMVFATKSDGTLWAWGRFAHIYTGVTDTNLDATPVRVGTNSDWRSISSSSDYWFCQGLIKKDGSLWYMDASAHNANWPSAPFQPVQFRCIEFPKEFVACAAGSAHAALPGVHGPISVMLTRDGEVWTEGMVLGDPLTFKNHLQNLAAKIGPVINRKIPRVTDPPPVYRNVPWRLPHESPDTPAQ